MDLGWKWPLSHCQFAFRFFRYLKKTHTNEQRQQAKQTKNPGTSSRIWVTIYKILQLPHTQILQLPKSSPQSVNQIFHCCFEQEKSSEGRDILYDACKSCSQVKSDTEKNPKSCRILRGTTHNLETETLALLSNAISSSSPESLGLATRHRRR